MENIALDLSNFTPASVWAVDQLVAEVAEYHILAETGAAAWEMAEQKDLIDQIKATAIAVGATEEDVNDAITRGSYPDVFAANR